MKTIFTLLVLVFTFSASINAQTIESLTLGVEKTLVKSIAVKTSTGETAVAEINLPGEVEVTEWDNDFVRVTTNLLVTNMSESIVKQLVAVGRYTLVSNLNEDTQTLSIEMPKISNLVTVRGVEVIEVLSFEINVPEGYEVVVKGAKESKQTNHLLGQSL